MEYSVEQSEDGQYIVVTMVGDIDRAGAVEITRARYALGRELGINCYLLDATRAHNVDRPLSNMHFTREDLPVESDDLRSECVALLVDPDDHSHDFYAAYARRHGIDTRIFWERAAAIWHLRAAAERDRGRGFDQSDGPSPHGDESPPQ